MSATWDRQAAGIDRIHTLGPTGTNCEAAARHWFERQGRTGEVVLHPTLEDAAEVVVEDAASALLGCIVYPDLHTLVFSNLDRFVLKDLFVMPTYEMVLASRTGEAPRLVSSHPAPRRLVPQGVEVRLVNSNAQAALDCAAGRSDACITTGVAARSNDLRIVENYGPVPMGFSIHVPLAAIAGAAARDGRALEAVGGGA